MLHSVRFTTGLDATKIWPVIIRDLLFCYARYYM